MKSQKKIVTAHQLAEIRGYSDINKLIEEAQKANLIFDIAGAPHIIQEDWDVHVLKSAAAQLASRKKSGKSLADTDQLGILNSNLKRLPESIRIKERKLLSKQTLYKDAPPDNEKYILSGEINKLENELKTHKENLKKAQVRQKQILEQRVAELEALESERCEPDNSANSTIEKLGDNQA